MRTKYRSGQAAHYAGGLVLMECLVYLSVWLVVAGVGFSLFYQVYIQSKHFSRGADDIVRTLKTGERWRAEVRQSRVAPSWEPRVEGVGWDFRVESDAGWVVYRFTGTNVLRSTAADPRWREVLGGVKSSAIEQDESRHALSWRWELELNPRTHRAKVEPRFTFQAVPRVQQDL
jgi:hypothetical protein